ncbi:MAG: FAD-binding protein, partial [Spirochaetales bacterium]
MIRLKEWAAKINNAGEIRQNELMSLHTTFRVGGPADLFALPNSPDQLRSLLTEASDARIPCFVLGGGANILVADKGIRGLVIDMSRIRSIESHDGLITV